MRTRYQVVATERFSLQEFCTFAGFSEPAETAGTKRRDLTDALATVGWYRRLHQKSGRARPYGIGLTVEPDAYWKKSESERFHRNKWPKYARGRHRPQSTLVDAAERAFPGSASELNHLVWAILKIPPTTLSQITELESKLGPDVRLAISRWHPRVRASKNGAITRFASALEQSASLDALAALLLQCRAAQLTGEHETALRWTPWIYRSLLMQGVNLLTLGVAQPLFELVELRLLSDVSHEGWRYWFPKGFYLEAVGALFDVLWHIEGAPYTSMNDGQRISYMRRVLDGDFGWDLKFAFRAVKRPCSDGTPMQEDALRDSQESINLFAWAWNMRRIFCKHPQLPPPEVFDGTDLWAKCSDWTAPQLAESRLA